MRWLRFNIVGALGFVLQTATLSALVVWTGLDTSVAVTVAVFLTASHNFLWHERYTWPGLPREQRWKRWASFQLSTGVLSVVSNVVVTAGVMAATGLPVVAANVVAVLVVSVVNFWVSDRVVFRA